MAGKIDRRTFLRGGAAAGMALAAGGIFVPRASAQGAATIRVTHFGGPFQALADIVGKPFEAAGHGKVIYEVENSVSAITKLQAQQGSPPPFNVVQFARSFAIRAGKTGLLEKMAPDDIQNVDALGKGALTPGDFGCMMMVDCNNIIYDSNRISRPIESWLDLWRPEFKQSIVLPSSSLPIYYIVMQVTRSMGGDPASAKDIDAAFKKLAEIRPNVRTFYNDPIQATQMIERGEIPIAVQFGIRSSNIMQKHRNIRRAIPDKEGAPAIPYDLCITKGSAHQTASKAYINMAVQQGPQAAIAKELLGTPVHKAAPVPADVKDLIVDFSKLWFPDEDYASQHSRDWGRRWTREVQG